jgi:hypothetical protein
MVQNLITPPPTNYGYKVLKTVTFDGTAGKGAKGAITLFTVTGTIRGKLTAWCTTNLAEEGDPGGATVEVGIAGNTAGLIAQTAALDIDAGDLWHDNSPDASLELAATGIEFNLTNGADIILTVATDEVNAGVITFCLEYFALPTDGYAEAA